MGITYFKIKEFTVFKNIGFDFHEGVNVIVGENATGKTHLLKLLYAYHNDKDVLLQDVFRNKGYKTSGGEVLSQRGISGTSQKFNCVFIPTKDMLTHSHGFTAMSEKFSEFPFDKTLIDIVEKAQQWKVKELPPMASKILPKLENMMEGKIIYENEDFFIEKEGGKRISFAMEAEGLKKVGLLWQLLMTENITKDTVLFWDEPEANLNPKFIPDLTEILLELSRNGVQIFVTTHSYIFAKYFDVRKKSDDCVGFYSLYKTKEKGIKCAKNKSFGDLKHNSIMQGFEKLLDEVYVVNKGE